MNFLRERPLSPAAADLVRFDEDSIRQIARAQHLAAPDVWLADPDAYEKDRRLLRDSESARMLAYSTKDQMLYATDGCNSCARSLRLPSQELTRFASENGIRVDLLEKLLGLV